MTVCIFNFDVLARPGTEMGARQPDPDGRALWNMFQYQAGLHTVIVADHVSNMEIFQTWLLREGIKASHYEILDSTDPVVKAEKVHLLTTMWGRAGWYVDTDPRTAALTIAKGIPTLVVASPYTIRPEWETEKPPRPWAELVDEMDRQRISKVTRAWNIEQDEGDEPDESGI